MTWLKDVPIISHLHGKENYSSAVILTLLRLGLREKGFAEDLVSYN